MMRVILRPAAKAPRLTFPVSAPTEEGGEGAERIDFKDISMVCASSIETKDLKMTIALKQFSAFEETAVRPLSCKAVALRH